MEEEKLAKIKYGDLVFYARKNVEDDYWALEAILFANEYSNLNIDPNDVVYDVGANIGVFTLLSAKKAKSVVSIEPEKGNFEILKLNVIRNNLNNVILVNKAVGDTKGKVSMSSTGVGASVIPGNDIELTTLDDIIEETGKIPDVIKMDIEGYEAKALRGFSHFRTLKGIIMEVHSPELLQEVSKILRENNFEIEDVSKPPISKIALSLLRHPLTFLHIEQIYGYKATKLIFKHLLLRAPHPIPAANDSGIYLIKAENKAYKDGKT